MVLCSQNVVVRDKVQIIVKNIGNRTISGPMKESALAMNISFSFPVFQVAQVDALLVPTNVLLNAPINTVATAAGELTGIAEIMTLIPVWNGAGGLIGMTVAPVITSTGLFVQLMVAMYIINTG